jgi:hypothetical protein
MLGYLREDLVGTALGSVECSLLDVFFWSDLALGKRRFNRNLRFQ